MVQKTYDVAVIGGGPAGYVAAIRAAQLGGDVVLFERNTVGGTCLNRGCIPTKNYLKTAEIIHDIRRAAIRGVINDPTVSVDMEKVVDCKEKAVRQLTGGVKSLLRSQGVKVVKGEATLSGEHTVDCAGESYQAKSIVLCGGSDVARIPIPGIDNANVLTSTEMLALSQLPQRLTVIGGGVIGCELACAFQAFGSQVSVVDIADRLLPMMDAELSAALAKSLEQQGIQLYLSQQVSAIIAGQEQTTLVCENGLRLDGDKILLSVGRGADLSCLGAMVDRIYTRHGKVIADRAMRTNIPHIYAAGDINGQLMLAHAASKMGEIAAENAMGKASTCDLSAVPSCVYTMPQVASVGMTEEEAIRAYGRDAISVGRFPLSANGRSVASGEPEGFVKVVVLDRYDELCGVHICGAHAAEMIAEPAALMATEITCEEAASIIHAHPSLSEAFMEACNDALGHCIHLPKTN
ncbi:MAG: dihydrolipoyl dehydrogenase [Clostridiales bacterium]|nr:dihydrolipoyl dehydrogenase [Clostridiales bacterium]